MTLPQRADLDPWVLFIAVTALVVAVWTSHSVRSTHEVRPVALGELLGVAAISAFVTGLVWGDIAPLVIPIALFAALSFILALGSRRLSVPGAAWLSISFMGLGIGWLWTCLFINDFDLPRPMEALALAGLTVTLVISFLAALERLAREAVLTHGNWTEPTRAPTKGAAAFRPKVSIHLPCYAEPPAVVQETMNCLARLDYDNFEVLVCDNNTKDEALWRPLEKHARLLNRKLGKEVFRFFHVAPLAGAKAGALNWLLPRMAPDAEIVAVVDADYHSTPDFLDRLVPFFANREVGYVQTPHDYREYEASPYLSACYAEYMPNNKVDMPGVHEYGGAFTIGTMCLLRADALQAAGGWAEWCLTEDSEISVRIRAIGYRGIYLNETFGRGLIPATFDDYKKQRFRWTAGPVQQMMRHWRLFLPSPYARPMPGWTKLLEVLRCIAPLQALLGVVTGLFTIGGLVAATMTGRIAPIDVPDVAWLLIPFAAATTLVRIWHRYRLSNILRFSDMVRGEVARASLSYVVLLAGIAGLSTKPLAWRRTPKFGAGDTLRGALYSAMPETVLGLALAGGAALFPLLAPAMGPEVAWLGAAGLATLAIGLLCAPYMAVLAVRSGRGGTRTGGRGVPQGTAGRPRQVLAPERKAA